MTKKSWYIIGIAWLVLCALFFWIKHFSGTSSGLLFSYIHNVAALVTPMKLLWVFVIGIVAGIAWYAHNRGPIKIIYRPWWLLVGFFIMSFCVFIPLTTSIWDVQVQVPATEPLRSLLLQEFGKTDTVLLSPFAQWFAFGEKAFWGLLSLLTLFFSAIGYGAIWKKFVPKEYTAYYPILLAIGFSSLIGLLFTAGILTLLSAMWVPLAILLTGVLCSVLFAREELAELIWKKRTFECGGDLSSLAWVLWAILFLVCTTTFVHVLRPIPIGWDDISLYMNLPKLVSEHGALVPGFGAYNWGIIMSLGFTVFQTPFVAMLFSALGGILALWGVYHCMIAVEGKEKRSIIPLLFTTVLAVSPFFLFQFGEDMKVDLILVFFGSVIGVLIQYWWKSDKKTWMPVVLIGVFLGVLLGIKFTALIFAFFVFFLLLWRAGGVWLSLSGTSIFLFILLLTNVFAFSGIEIDHGVKLALYIVSGILALSSFILAIVRKTIVTSLFVQTLVTATISMLIFAPWLGFQWYSFYKNNEPVPSFQAVLMGRPVSPVIPEVRVTAPEERTAEEDEKVNELIEDVQEEGGAVKEELGRYQGFDRDAFHFLGLPFDVTLSKNVSGDYVTIGWVYLGLFGLIVFAGVSSSRARRRDSYLIGGLTLLSLYLLLRSYFQISWLEDGIMYILAIISRGAIQAASAGTIVQIIIVVLAGLAVVGLWKKTEHDPWINVLFYATLLYGVWWTLLASGVVWYGVLLLVGLFPLAAYTVSQIQHSLEKKTIIWVIFLLWILPMSLYRLTMTTTTVLGIVENAGEMAYAQESVTSLDQRQFILYKAGVLNEEEGFEFMNQEYYLAQKIFNKDESKIYRIGTLIPYFVEKNNERILTDNQLDIFFEKYMPHKDKNAFTEALKEGGFRYIIFDANTASIDQTTEKTLTRKVELFQEYVENNERLKQVPLTQRTGSVYIFEIL